VARGMDGMQALVRSIKSTANIGTYTPRKPWRVIILFMTDLS
jgi:hypothetical protein